MHDIISTYEEWYDEYVKDRDRTCVVVDFSDGTQAYFTNLKQWLEVKDICEKNNSSISKLSLQFRSHKVETDIKDADGVYLVGCLKGQFGAEAIHYIISGKVVGESVTKQMWMVPELIIEETIEETVENCFEEAIIYQDGKRKI